MRRLKSANGSCKSMMDDWKISHFKISLLHFSGTFTCCNPTTSASKLPTQLTVKLHSFPLPIFTQWPAGRSFPLAFLAFSCIEEELMSVPLAIYVPAHTTSSANKYQFLPALKSQTLIKNCIGNQLKVYKTVNDININISICRRTKAR